jgi:hypothetical protein
MLNDDETRSLEALARAPDGCAEAVLLADGFTIRQLSGLVIDGFATLERRRINVGGRERPVFWMQITGAGRKAMAERKSAAGWRCWPLVLCLNFAL